MCFPAFTTSKGHRVTCCDVQETPNATSGLVRTDTHSNSPTSPCASRMLSCVTTGSSGTSERGRFGHRHLVTLHQLRDVRGLSHTESLAVLVPLQLHPAELRPSCLVHPLRRAANPLLIDPLVDILHQGGRSHRQEVVHVDQWFSPDPAG